MFKTVNDGRLPKRGTKHSACVDLYANQDVIIWTGTTELIELGVAIDDDWIKSRFIEHLDDNASVEEKNNAVAQYAMFKESHYMQLMLRSSLSQHLLMTNGVGVIDLDYRGEMKISLHNPLEEKYNIKRGDRIAQITLLEHKSYLFDIESEEVRLGGFGSTNEKETL